MTIITDSTANFTREEAEALGVEILPLAITFGMESYLDGVDLTIDAFYEKLIEGKDFPHTSQIPPSIFEERFLAAKERGETLFLLLISSNLSGTYSTACAVKERIGYEGICVYDCLTTTAMQRLLVLEAVKHRDESIEEALAAVDALRPRVELYAMMDTLEYLAKGGRLKASMAFLGNLLGIKPVITLSREGKVEVLSKERSVRHAFRKIRQLVRPEEIDWDYPVYYMYTQNRSGSELLCEALTPERKDLLSSALNICPAIGTHIGPNAAGITFVRKQ